MLAPVMRSSVGPTTTTNPKPVTATSCKVGRVSMLTSGQPRVVTGGGEQDLSLEDMPQFYMGLEASYTMCKRINQTPLGSYLPVPEACPGWLLERSLYRALTSPGPQWCVYLQELHRLRGSGLRDHADSWAPGLQPRGGTAERLCGARVVGRPVGPEGRSGCKGVGSGGQRREDNEGEASHRTGHGDMNDPAQRALESARASTLCGVDALGRAWGSSNAPTQWRLCEQMRKYRGMVGRTLCMRGLGGAGREATLGVSQFPLFVAPGVIRKAYVEKGLPELIPAWKVTFQAGINFGSHFST